MRRQDSLCLFRGLWLPYPVVSGANYQPRKYLPKTDGESNLKNHSLRFLFLFFAIIHGLLFLNLRATLFSKLPFQNLKFEHEPMNSEKQRIGGQFLGSCFYSKNNQ